MGKVMSIMSRKVNRFNVENRAHRLLDKDKLPPAPKFESNLKDIERTLEEDPGFMERQSRKDSALDERLKQVYVTSEDNYIDHAKRHAENPYRPLPLARATVDDFEYGFKEPTKITPGKCTLRQAMQFIADSQADPEKWTKQKIADEYKMKEEIVGKILENFRSFAMYVPDKRQKENILTAAKNKALPAESDTSQSEKP